MISTLVTLLLFLSSAQCSLWTLNFTAQASGSCDFTLKLISSAYCGNGNLTEFYAFVTSNALLTKINNNDYGLYCKMGCNASNFIDSTLTQCKIVRSTALQTTPAALATISVIAGASLN